MSGIAAIFNRDGRPVAREDIERVARALAIYGPERQTVRLMGPVAFAYAHFTATPESRGEQQPATGGGGRYSLVFDGRLDNRDDLAVALAIDGDEMRMLPDSAVAMRSWERWGEESLNRWMGEFALIVWDASEQRLIAARHQFGRRTLSYHERPDRLVVASAPKGLHALPDIPREIDEQKIADALCQLYTDAARSYFKGISRLPPASLLVAGGERLEVRRYYDLRDHIRPVRYACDDDYVEHARELFTTSVRACLRSPGQVGAFMSGGLDSSTAAVTAAGLLAERGQRLPVYTWVPEPGWDGRTGGHAYGDETPYVRAIAEQTPAIDLNLVDAAGLGIYHRQDALLHAIDGPVRNVGNTAWFHAIMERAKSHGVKVMLDGAMGNDTLSYPGEDIYVHHWTEGNYRQLLKEFAHARRGPFDLPRQIFTHLLIPLGPDWLWKVKERLRGRAVERERWLDMVVAAAPAFADEKNVLARARATGFDFFEKPPARLRDRWIWMLTRHGASELGDAWQGMSALYGMDVRDPFGDRRLIEWCMGVPEDQYHRDGQNRWLVRRLMRGLLPDAVLSNRRRGLQTSDWHLRMTRDLDQMRGDVESLARDPDTARMINLPRLRGLLSDWPDQTVTDVNDDRRIHLQTTLPIALQIGRFVQRVKGVNH